jgi:iron(III) transport system permease protein
MSAYCAAGRVLMLAMLGMAVFASFASFWPYNLRPAWHYTMGLVDAEVGDGLRQQPDDGRWHRGVRHAAGLCRRLPAGEDARRGARAAVRLLAMLPMAVPGLVLGLGYIFFFNQPANPLNGLYHTLTLLTLCTIVHFYTTGHLTAVTALKALDAEFEAVSAS